MFTVAYTHSHSPIYIHIHIFTHLYVINEDQIAFLVQVVLDLGLLWVVVLIVRVRILIICNFLSFSKRFSETVILRKIRGLAPVTSDFFSKKSLWAANMKKRVILPKSRKYRLFLLRLLRYLQNWFEIFLQTEFLIVPLRYHNNVIIITMFKSWLQERRKE